VVAKKVTLATVKARVAAISETLKNHDFSALRFGPLQFVQVELASGSLRNLQVELRPMADRVMDYSEDSGGKLLLLSQRFLDAANRLATERRLSARQTAWMIDNFLIHEFLHEAQGMGGGRHSDLRLHSPQTLLAIDYQADAAAVVIQVALAWYEPAQFGFKSAGLKTDHWTLYEEGVLSVIHQIDIFTYLGEENLNRQEAVKLRTSVERVQRIATWHFQAHRLRLFNRGLGLADFQILLQPTLDFRNLAHAGMLEPDLIGVDWPESEPRFIAGLKASRKKSLGGADSRKVLIIACGSAFGTTRFYRFDPASPQHYVDAFKGFFSADLELSRRFFQSLIGDCEWMIGQIVLGSKGIARSGSARQATKVDSRGLAMNLVARKRAQAFEQLLRPEQFALVYAKK
jgi:hypothetical protein